MTRSAVHPRTSPGRRSRSRGAALLALLFGGATLLGTGTVLAKKKKSTNQPAQQAADEASPDKAAVPAPQVGDTEKPKAIIDTSQEAPKTDNLGHVHFGLATATGLGRVAVKAAPESKIKVFLEGRYFGTAPLTIYSVPKGDYILEATYPAGKEVSKPVTVSENEETAVDLSDAQTLTSGDGGTKMFAAEMTPARMHLTEAFLIGAGVGVITAVTFGILELREESAYNNTSPADQPKLDSITKTGKNYALLTNLGIVVTAVGLVGAGVAGYPLIFNSGEKKTALLLTPAFGPGLAGGVATLRF